MTVSSRTQDRAVGSCTNPAKYTVPAVARSRVQSRCCRTAACAWSMKRAHADAAGPAAQLASWRRFSGSQRYLHRTAACRLRCERHRKRYRPPPLILSTAMRGSRLANCATDEPSSHVRGSTKPGQLPRRLAPRAMRLSGATDRRPQQFYIAMLNQLGTAPCLEVPRPVASFNGPPPFLSQWRSDTSSRRWSTAQSSQVQAA